MQKEDLTSQETHDDVVDILRDDAPSYQLVKDAKGAGRLPTVDNQKNINRV